MAPWLIEDGDGCGWARACAVGTRQEQPWYGPGWNRAVPRAQGMSTCPSSSGRELGWFWLLISGALYNGADVLGALSAPAAKQHSPSTSILRAV